MIDITATKGYEYIKIPIYFNENDFDLDSIREEFEENIRELIENYLIVNGEIVKRKK